MNSSSNEFSLARLWDRLASTRGLSPELRRRVSTGALLFAVVFLLAYGAAISCAGAVALRFVVLGAALITCMEGARLVAPSRESQLLMVPILGLPTLFTLFLAIGTQDVPAVSCTATGSLDELWPLRLLSLGAGLAPAVFMTLIWALWAMREPAQILVGLAPRLVLLLHVGLGWGSMAVMTLLPAGSVWLLVLVLVVSSGDIGAYFGGRYFKGSKLLEPVSPGKTWSGAAVGLLASVGVAVLVVPLVRWGQDGALASAVYGVAAAIAAQVGDLLKSTLKRVAGVKDSGNILPGHGGLYDRIDGLLAAAPIALFLMVLP